MKKKRDYSTEAPGALDDAEPNDNPEMGHGSWPDAGPRRRKMAATKQTLRQGDRLDQCDCTRPRGVCKTCGGGVQSAERERRAIVAMLRRRRKIALVVPNLDWVARTDELTAAIDAIKARDKRAAKKVRK